MKTPSFSQTSAYKRLLKLAGLRVISDDDSLLVATVTIPDGIDSCLWMSRCVNLARELNEQPGINALTEVVDHNHFYCCQYSLLTPPKNTHPLFFQLDQAILLQQVGFKREFFYDNSVTRCYAIVMRGTLFLEH